MWISPLWAQLRAVTNGPPPKIKNWKVDENEIMYFMAVKVLLVF